MTAVYKNKIRENFRIWQEAEEQKLREEERQKQIELDKMLAMKLQQDERKSQKMTDRIRRKGKAPCSTDG